jgi:bifunctional non-homologous end joining protein LigD
MLAKASPPFDSEEHLFELKWDGTRCIAFVERKSLRLQNRRLRDITARYPEFEGLGKDLRARSAVLDGEMVVLSGGLPDFGKLQQREHQQSPARIRTLSGLMPATYIVFDLLYLDGKPLMKTPLQRRRELLSGLLPVSGGVILSQAYDRGKELFSLAVEMGFEGVMAKQRQSPYLPGERSGYWLKIKRSTEIDAVVCGYLEGRGGRSLTLGSLILGLYRQGSLVHIGRVGSGLDEKTLGSIRRILEKLETDRCPFHPVPRFPRKARWARPELVATVGFQQWSRDERLRAPVFKRIRYDKDPRECTFEQ